MKREFTMLAQRWDPDKTTCAGKYLSEKLDGMRAIWDGGISRGKAKAMIPWANTKKDKRYNTPPVATGLWSRLGNVIHAPDWFLDQLPKGVLLDGELFCKQFRQETMSIVKQLIPDERWMRITYFTFDMPSTVKFAEGKITNFYCRPLDFQEVQSLIYHYNQENVQCVTQIRLHPGEEQAREAMNVYLERVLAGGGEGVMLRAPFSRWIPERSHSLLKNKPFDDMEGTVIGWISGRETDKGSKLLGMMGALVLRLPNGKELELSGFTDAERTLTPGATGWAVDHPGERIPVGPASELFPIGTVVTFKYRGLSKDGVPQEARYWRNRDEE